MTKKAAGNTVWRGRLSTVDLLALSKAVQRGSTVLGLPLEAVLIASLGDTTANRNYPKEVKRSTDTLNDFTSIFVTLKRRAGLSTEQHNSATKCVAMAAVNLTPLKLQQSSRFCSNELASFKYCMNTPGELSTSRWSNFANKNFNFCIDLRFVSDWKIF
jgi:hypothetical protein